ncbi:hypothetical protein CPAR01_00557 [Colletotrichum paranaense]|uniref:Uncharacterized protein n=1 Tax=Colletotrichum paranaense TaxID=1914294 RepID=A0ABQ9T4Q2_9PEZI|nr:uncharacterized protein CPAR01_00557 [Colletotrichum paranaense]KAK1546590.1 hypothetical protein CPAR01_00557 [Colletotrichum paranaense]
MASGNAIEWAPTLKRTGFIYKSTVLSFILTSMSDDDDKGAPQLEGKSSSSISSSIVLSSLLETVEGEE